MSCSFNGTTSKDENTGAAHGITTLVTIVAWLFARGQGEGGFGQVLDLSENGEAVSLQHNNSADTLEFDSGNPVVDGRWTFPATDLKWNAVAVSMDLSDLLNNPVARVNFQNVTVTEIQAPAQLSPTPADGYCIGANTNQTFTWDGGIAFLHLHNVILTSEEMDQQAKCPGSVRRGLVLERQLRFNGDTKDLSGNGFNGTQTAITTIDSPVIAPCGAGFTQYTKEKIRRDVNFNLMRA